MNAKERLVDWFESMYIGLALAWTIGFAIVLLQPQAATEHHGTVEVYSLVAADGSSTTI
jgi:hypothetical protein